MNDTQYTLQNIVYLALFAIVGTVPISADEFPDSLSIPNVLRHLPENFKDGNRKFQGIPSLEVSPGGRLWACWYTGGGGEDGENFVLLSTSGDQGKTWKIVRAVDMPGPVRNYDPSIWCDPDGKLWFFWAQSRRYWDGRSGVWCMTTKTPEKEDAEWTAPKRICDGIMMCKPLADSKGRWLLPVAVWNLDIALEGRGRADYFKKLSENPDYRAKIHPACLLPTGANVIASKDKGETWKFLGNASVPKEDVEFDEHNIIEHKDGSYRMLIRTKYGIAESISTNDGVHWSEPKPSSYLHPSARFFMRRLKSGNILFVKHGGLHEKTPDRRCLTAFLSQDDGKTWQGGLLLDERSGISYPDGGQDRDGTIYVIYDFDRYQAREILMAKFTERDILAGKQISAECRFRMLVNKAGQFTPRSNADGKLLMKGESPTFELNNAEIDTFKKDVKLFADRDHYRLKNFLPELDGKKFIRSPSIRNTGGVVCKTPGIVYVYTPLPHRNKDNIVEYLLKNGFEKVAVPEVMLFGDYTGNIATLYQKEIKAGDTFEFGCWGLIVF